MPRAGRKACVGGDERRHAMSSQKTAEARGKAEALWAKNKAKEVETLKERERERAAETAKTSRLRALRLAKEAADKIAAEKAAAEKAAAAAAAKPAKRVKRVAAATG